MKTQLNTTIMALLLTAISTTVTATDTVATASKATTSTAPTIATVTNLKEVVTKDFSVADIKKDSKKAVKTAVLTPKTTTESTDTKAETTTTATTKVTDSKEKAIATKTEVTDPKVTKIKITAPVIVTVPTEATAAKKLPTGYVGVSVGASNLDMGITDLNGTTFDENNQGVKIVVGFNVDEHLSIEGHFANLGGGTLSGKNSNTFLLNGTEYTFDVKDENGEASTATALVDATTVNYGIAGVYNFINIYDFANTNKITPFVKVGLHKWETKFDSNAINVITDDLKTVSGTDAFYGVGVSAEITDGIRAKLEFERFGMNKDTDYISLVIVSDY
jgi:hypothetical protein